MADMKTEPEHKHEELLPCPFCGPSGRPGLTAPPLAGTIPTGPWLDSVQRDGYDDCPDDEDARAYFVRCPGCDTQGPWAKRVGTAVMRWNMRPPAAASARDQSLFYDLAAWSTPSGVPMRARPEPSAHETPGGQELFYILEASSVVGNCALWWRPEGRGYTCDLADAGKYTAEQAEAARQRPSDVPVPCAVADAAAARHVHLDSDALREYVARGRGLDVPA